MTELLTSLRIMAILGVEYALHQRLILAIFATWIVGFDLALVVAGGAHEQNDFGAMYQQQSIWGIIFVVFLASSLLKQERDSRRVLGVLSKGISRFEYLGGQIAGIGLLAAIYYGLATLLYCLIAWRFDLTTYVAGYLLAGLLISALAAAVALFVSTWLHPLAASGITIALLTAPMLVLGNSELLVIAPAAYYLRAFFPFDPSSAWSSPWTFWLIAAVETCAAWLAAAFVFERQDVAVPTE